MMNRHWRMSIFLSLILAVPLAAALDSFGEDKVDTGRAVVARIVVDGPISPISADYIQKQVEMAQSEGLDLVILQLDTPGGLLSSTRQIVKTLLGSEIPIAVYVAPPGARAASAGVFITMAAHVAAMAPGTHIGAAHPVNIGGGNPLSPNKETPEEEKRGKGEEGKEQDAERSTQAAEDEKPAPPAENDKDVMGQKVLNDTVAFIRSIAEKQGRNADWAEKAVRESVSVTETEALELEVIDIIAGDVEELLAAMDGMTVKVSGGEIVLAVKGGTVLDRPMGWRYRVLGTLSDPNIAYILMMLGIYGLFFELANPGVIFPGVLGGIFLILAFFSFQVIPINYAGFLLIFLAVILFILEVAVVSYGMLSVGGVAALFLGSTMLFDTAEPYYKLSLSLVVGVTAFTALFFVVGLGLVIRDKRKRPTTGAEGLIGEAGVVTVPLTPQGTVKVHGEIWRAQAQGQVDAGSKVKVKAIEGLMLTVEEIDENNET
ncbi:MAG: nodulation protein NfeD [bacterium]|nr:nodulation protein NfeD [bacterium]MDT8366883.1 nodulation protein NfeD [bacterium]